LTSLLFTEILFKNNALISFLKKSKKKRLWKLHGMKLKL
jgi:hypothetical protein